MERAHFITQVTQFQWPVACPTDQTSGGTSNCPWMPGWSGQALGCPQTTSLRACSLCLLHRAGNGKLDMLAEESDSVAVWFFSPHLIFHYCCYNGVCAIEESWVPKNKMPDKKIWLSYMDGVLGGRCQRWAAIHVVIAGGLAGIAQTYLAAVMVSQ